MLQIISQASGQYYKGSADLILSVGYQGLVECGDSIKKMK